MADRFESLTNNRLLFTAVCSNIGREFGFIHMRSYMYPASLRSVGGSTLRCPLVPEIMHEGVFLHQIKPESRGHNVKSFTPNLKWTNDDTRDVIY